MKKIFLLLGFLAVIAGVSAQKSLQAYLSYTSFYVPDGQPYVETYLSVAGNSINYVEEENGKYRGAIEVMMIFKQNDTVVNYDKYELKSPLVEDTMDVQFNILDQQRYVLKNGSYDMEIWIADKYSEKPPFIHTEPLTIVYQEGDVNVSGIELIASYKESDEQNMFTKNGLELRPYISNYFPDNVNNLMFYTEIYNTSGTDNEKFLLDYYIESFETARKLIKYETIRRKDAAEVVPLLASINITDLPSGNYKLVVEARDKNNELIAFNKLFFQRSNPDVQFDIDDILAVNIKGTFVEGMNDIDTLKEYIHSLEPISSEMEKQFAIQQLGQSSLSTLQQYFLNFWLTRDNLEPGSAWMEYKNQVDIVNEAYGTSVSNGYETDRGRVHLKYGPPNIITESYNEPGAYPYEIWHYYTLGQHQRDRKFVFMANDNVTNNFQLIHSNATGELSNYRWQVLLHKRTSGPTSIDEFRTPDAWGNKAGEYYKDPF